MAKNIDADSIKVKELMSQRTVTTSPEKQVSEVLGMMRKNNIHEVPVIERNKLVGIVTYTHLIKRRKIALTSQVRNVMVSPPSISPDDSLITVSDVLLTNGFRAVPVIEKKGIAGVVSRTDVIRATKGIKEITEMPVGRIMTSNPVSIGENEGVIKAKDTMRDMGIRTLPVVDKNGEITGAFGLKDISSFFEANRIKASKGEVYGEKNPVNIEVKSIMHSPPITVNQKANVGAVIDLMTKHSISSVFVEEKQKPVGIITQADILGILAGLKERKGAYVQITGLEEDPSVYNTMYKIIEKYLKRINKMSAPQMLLLHVATYHPKGKTAKYSVSAKLNTPRKLFVSKSRAQLYQWDLMKSLDEVMSHLEKMVRREKEKEKDIKKRSSKNIKAGLKKETRR
ncbi:MAG: CBS domain-containing protein [Thermoplasmatales archaeon]|nr:CBS domain-containing protein [Thermoplasmatales archaeon]